MLLKFGCRGDSLDIMKLQSQMMVGKKQLFTIILKVRIKSLNFSLISTHPIFIEGPFDGATFPHNVLIT